ncbi:fungal-specific transcription factor domain-containing protein [Trichoderma chlorosporum]
MSVENDTRVIIPRMRPSCSQCQRSKKRCDREKPQCSLCVRYGRKCVYSSTAGVVGNDQAPSTSASPDLSPMMTQESEESFPAVFFLDSVLFRRSLNRLPDLDLSLSIALLDYVDQAASDRAFVSKYFATLHPSIPFLSKRGFKERVLNPLSPPRPANTLLVASMKLVATPLTEEGPRCKAYFAIKKSLLEAENCCILELRLLQAIILIAIYELGHAIYPAAYLTVGYCVRYGSALGIHKAVELYSEEDFSITESEERRRSWWAILVLDRFISLGSADRVFLTTDPSTNSLLPIDDAKWEDNKEVDAPVRRLFEPPTASMGRFSLTAQAAILLGRVFRNIQEFNVLEGFWQNDVKVLDDTLVALTNVSLEEGRLRGIGVCSPSTICYSARLLLHDTQRYAIGKIPPSTTGGFVSQDFKQEIAAGMLRLAHTITATNGCAAEEITPFCLEAIYRGAVFYAQEYTRTGAHSASASCQAIREALTVIGKNWKAAAFYVELIDARLVTGIL